MLLSVRKCGRKRESGEDRASFPVFDQNSVFDAEDACDRTQTVARCNPVCRSPKPPSSPYELISVEKASFFCERKSARRSISEASIY